MTRKTEDLLRQVSTAAITSVLLKQGFRNVWLRGAMPLRFDQPNVVGTAFTLRFIPVREDLVDGTGPIGPINTRAAVEDMPAGSIVVADAMGSTDAGIVGDVLCARMVKRGVAGLVTDGAIRDQAGVQQTGLPVWSGGVAAPPPFVSLSFVGWQEPVACGGVAVVPGDLVVADGDGVVVIPAALAEAVAEQAVELERADLWVLGEIERGHALPGLYPMNAVTKVRYESERP